MKSKRKTPKTLCMIVSILFVTLIFVPNSKNHFYLQVSEFLVFSWLLVS